MKKHISSIIFVLSIILALPLLLKIIFKYEIPKQVEFIGQTIDSWSVIRAIGVIVIIYVVYVNVKEYKENKQLEIK